MINSNLVVTKIGKVAQTGLAAVALLLAGGVSNANATTFAYGYAEQMLSNITVSANADTMTSTGTSSASSAVIGGVGVSTNGMTDALEAYDGAGPAAPQNYFAKYSAVGGGSQAGDFTRGDVVLSGAGNLFTSGAMGTTVAESYSSIPELSTASSNYLLSGSFTTAATSITVSYDYANDIVTMFTEAGTNAGAHFGVQISVKDQHGHEVDVNPTELNTSFNAPPSGPEVITSGSGSAVLSLLGLTAGDTYSLAIAGQSSSSAIAETPEPASLGLFSLGAGALAFLRRRRA